MKSTGEVMGVGQSFGEAFSKASLAAGSILPRSGKVFISVREADRGRVGAMARDFAELGFEIYATRGTAAVIEAAGVPVQRVNKVAEGRPHIVDMIKNEEIAFIVNTTEGKQAIADSYAIRRTALQHKVSYTTTLDGGVATCLALRHECQGNVYRLQDLH